MKKRKKNQAAAPSLLGELSALFDKYPDDGAVVIVHQVAERDAEGERKWCFRHRGSPTVLRLMMTHALGNLSELRHAEEAEALRSPAFRRT